MRLPIKPYRSKSGNCPERSVRSSDPFGSKGRGRAVKVAWESIPTDYVAYMDVDLSTDLKHLPALVGSLTRGYDVAIGSRNAHGSRVYGRSLLRTITSKGYILLIKLFFGYIFQTRSAGLRPQQDILWKVLCRALLIMNGFLIVNYLFWPKNQDAGFTKSRSHG